MSNEDASADPNKINFNIVFGIVAAQALPVLAVMIAANFAVGCELLDPKTDQNTNLWGCGEALFARYQTLVSAIIAGAIAWRVAVPAFGQLREMTRQSAAVASAAVAPLAVSLDGERAEILAVFGKIVQLSFERITSDQEEEFNKLCFRYRQITEDAGHAMYLNDDLAEKRSAAKAGSYEFATEMSVLIVEHGLDFRGKTLRTIKALNAFRLKHEDYVEALASNGQYLRRRTIDLALSAATKT